LLFHVWKYSGFADHRPHLEGISQQLACQILTVGGKTYAYYSLHAAERNGLSNVSRLPRSLKVIIENMMRKEDGHSTRKGDIEDADRWAQNKGLAEKRDRLSAGRLLMQDLTALPA
jgi:aconitate hydratase